MTEFKTILLKDDFTLAYYSKKSNKDYATLKCKIIKELPSEEEVKSFIKAIKDFYETNIDTNLQFKIKLDIKDIGFIGFSNAYECVKCFRTEKAFEINNSILIDTTILIANSKMKYMLDSIFLLLNPVKPVIFKCSDDIINLEKSEQVDITNTLTTLFDW